MIFIDTVYQRVLALANKEQRGYITPLEFNLLANQAQLMIFEQYFYDLDQVKRIESDTASFSDMEELIKNKLTPFITQQAVIGNSGTASGGTFPPNYRIGRIFVNGYEARKVEVNDIKDILNSTFHSSGLSKSPVYIEFTSATGSLNPADIRTFPASMGNAVCEVISKPDKVEWGYDIVAEKPLYNASGSTANFQLHASEETELVYKILALAGVTIKKIDIQQAGMALDMTKTQQEKL